MIDREQFLEAVRRRRSDEVVVHTMGTCNYWNQISGSDLDFYVAGAMGFASSVGLGLALSAPEHGVWVFDGDGSLLMNLGTLVTCADASAPNFRHFVLDNRMYELTGRVARPGREASLLGLARAAGYHRSYALESPDDLTSVLPTALAGSGPVFIHVAVNEAIPEPVRAPAAQQDASRAAARMGDLLRRASAEA